MENQVQQKKRPIEAGWMTLRRWAEMTETRWEKALALANPDSKRTAKTFDARDIDRVSNQDIRVWYTPPHPITGGGRPRTVRRKVSPSNAEGTAA